MKSIGDVITIKIKDFSTKNVQLDTGAVKTMATLNGVDGAIYKWGSSIGTIPSDKGISEVTGEIFKIKDLMGKPVYVLKKVSPTYSDNNNHIISKVETPAAEDENELLLTLTIVGNTSVGRKKYEYHIYDGENKERLNRLTKGTDTFVYTVKSPKKLDDFVKGTPGNNITQQEYMYLKNQGIISSNAINNPYNESTKNKKIRFTESLDEDDDFDDEEDTPKAPGKITIAVKEIISDKILTPRSNSSKRVPPIRFLDILGQDGQVYRALLSPYDKTSFKGVTHIEADVTGIKGNVTYIGRLVGRTEKVEEKPATKPTQVVQPELPLETPVEEAPAATPTSAPVEAPKEKPAKKSTKKTTASSKSWESFNVSGTSMPVAMGAAYIKKRFKEFNDAYFGGGLSLEGIVVKAKSISSSDHAAGMVTAKDSPLAYMSPDFSAAPTEPSNHPQFTQIGAFMIGERGAPERTEKAWCEIIIHEMIHMYQFQILRRSGVELKREEETSHGESFLAKMREINEKGGWNVTATSENLDDLVVSQETLRAVEEKGAVIMTIPAVNIPRRFRSKDFISMVAFTKDLTEFMIRHIPNAVDLANFYEIKDIRKVSGVPFYGSESSASRGIGIISVPVTSFNKVVKEGYVVKSNDALVSILKGKAGLDLEKLASQYYLVIFETSRRPKYSVQLIDKKLYSLDRLRSILSRARVPVTAYEIRDFTEFVGMDSDSSYGFTAAQVKSLISQGAIIKMNLKETSFISFEKKDDKIALFEAIYEASKEESIEDEMEAGDSFAPSFDENGFEKII